MVEIRPYQADGLEFLVARRRAALFDDPGLGKTMQALLAMDDLVPEGRILIVATGDAIGVWQDEIDFWLGQHVDVVSGPKADVGLFSEGERFVLTNYTRLADALEARNWQGMIFDEAQTLRNRNTRTLYKTVRAYFDKARYGYDKIPLFLLSGSPVVKGAQDLWPLLHLIDRHRWPSFWDFANEYTVVWQDQFGWHIEGTTNAIKLWRDEVSPVALRRLVEEVQPHLPGLIRQRMPLEMTTKQAKVYRDLEKDMVAEVGDGYILTPSILALETRLRQVLVSPRILGVDDDGAGVSALRGIAERTARPFVVYTPFVEAFQYIEPALMRSGRPVYTVRGGMGARLRESVDLFKRAAGRSLSPILLVSVHMAKSWSVSTVTNECYMLGFDWNATTMTQAERRLHRDGQTRTVLAHYLSHTDTHDMEQLDLVAGKRRQADIILDRARRRAA